MPTHLLPVQKKRKMGFINDQGQVVIDFQFDLAFPFSEGLATVFHKHKAGCIDTTGKLVVPIQFEDIGEFSDGLAFVKVKGKIGYIDKQGEIVIPPTFLRPRQNFHQGFAVIETSVKPWAIIIDKKGDTVLTNGVTPVSEYNEGLINCNIADKWGFMTIAGEMAIEPKFDYARPFYEGLAAVQFYHSFKNIDNTALYGFINKQGEMVIQPTFRALSIKFSEERCKVWAGQYGYIDPSGELVIPYQFRDSGDFSEGLAYFNFTEDGPYGFIDKQGNVVIQPKFDEVESFKHGLAAVYLGKPFGKRLTGYINKVGDYVWEPSR